jgi:hypothetical protein
MVMGKAFRLLVTIAAVGALGACGVPSPGVATADLDDGVDSGLTILRGGHGGHGGGHRGGRHGGGRHGWGRHGGWHRGYGWHGGYGWRGNYGWAGWNSWYPGLDYGYAYGFAPWVLPYTTCNPRRPWYPQCPVY